MADYKIADDGKIHTRYSELMRCTPGQIDRVLAERFAGAQRAETESMAFGTDRHEMWAEEAEKTRKVPSCFGLDWPVSHVEHEFTTEILPGIVVHSRIDTLCAGIQTIVDYKTVLNGVNGYEKNLAKYQGVSKQLTFYAWQVGMHGHRITKSAYLCEIWSSKEEERWGKTILVADEIIGYRHITSDIRLADIAAVLPDIKKKAALLAVGIEEWQSRKKVAVGVA